MQNILNNIQNYKHIVIVVPENNFIGYLSSANALYTYFLQLHKKVSIYKETIDFSLNIRFLPWIDKVKTSYPASADIKIEAISSIKLFEFFKELDIKLNRKMATSLYAGLLYETDCFKKNVTKHSFIMAQELLEFGADVDNCIKNIVNYRTLSSLRLKAILLDNMLLKDEATLAELNLTDKDLKQSGAKIDDVDIILDEVLSLVSVTKVIVIYKEKIIRSKCE